MRLTPLPARHVEGFEPFSWENGSEAGGCSYRAFTSMELGTVLAHPQPVEYARVEARLRIFPVVRSKG